MDLRHVSDGFHLDRKDSFGREASVPSWFPAGSLAHFAIDTGGNGAGNGGDRLFAGGLVHRSYAAFGARHIAHAGGPPPPHHPPTHHARFSPSPSPTSRG